jgi:hypothetical protein
MQYILKINNYIIIIIIIRGLLRLHSVDSWLI